MMFSRRNGNVRLSLIPDSAGRKRMAVVAFLVAAAFVNLEIGAAVGFASSAAAAAEKSATRSLAVKVFPKKSSDEGLAKAVYVVLRGVADRLAGQGFVRASGMPSKAAAAMSDAWKMVDSGRAMLKDKKFQEAFAAFTEADRIVKPYVGYADRALVAHIYKGLGLGYLAASKPQQAKKAIKTSLFVYPQQTKSEYGYTRETENFFLSAQREIVDSPRGAMDTESVPAGAEVYVDYVFRGFSPLAVQELVVGEHIVTFMTDGYEPLTQFVEITGGPNEFAMGEMVELENSAAISSAMAALGASIDQGTASAKAGQVATLIGATDFVAVNFGETGDTFRVDGLYVGNGQVKTIGSTISKDSDVMAEVEGIIGRSMNTLPPKVLTLAPLEPDMVKVVAKSDVAADDNEMAFASDEELIIDPNSPLFKDANKNKGDSVVKKWWFWTALILGLGAVGGLTYWGITANDGGSGGTPTGGIQINLNGVR